MSNNTEVIRVGLSSHDQYDDQDWWLNYRFGYSASDDLFHYMFFDKRLSFKKYKASKSEMRALDKSIQRGKMDVLFSEKAPTKWDSESLSLSNIVSVAHTAILSKNCPQRIVNEYYTMLSLDMSVWFFYFTALAMLLVLLQIFEKPFDQPLSNLDLKHLNKRLKLLVFKGKCLAPARISSVIIFLCLMFEIGTICTYYYGSLRASYTTDVSEVMDTLDDLVERRRAIIVARTSPSYSSLIHLCRNNNKYGDLLTKMKRYDYYTLEKMRHNGSFFGKIRSGQRVFVDTVQILRSVIVQKGNAKRRVYRIGTGRYFPKPMLFFMKKNVSTSILKHINSRIGAFVSTKQEEPSERKKRWFLHQSDTKSETFSSSTPLNVSNFMFIFCSYLFGLAFLITAQSIVLFFAHKCRKSIKLVQ